MSTQLTINEWKERGYSHWVAEALHGRELTERQVEKMGTTEILDAVLCWNGIIGFTQSILHAVNNIRAVRGSTRISPWNNSRSMPSLQEFRGIP